MQKFKLGEPVTLEVSGTFEGEKVTVKKHLYVYAVSLASPGTGFTMIVYHLGPDPEGYGDYTYTNIEQEKLIKGHPDHIP